MALRNAVASTSKIPFLLRGYGQRYHNESHYEGPPEPTKPPSAFHYTGEPAIQDEIDKLRRTERDVRTRLLESGISHRYMGSNEEVFERLGLDKTQIGSIPQGRWQSAFDIGMRLSCPVNEEQRSRIVTSLESLQGLLHQAALYDRLYNHADDGSVAPIRKSGHGKKKKKKKKASAAEPVSNRLKGEIAKALAPFMASLGDASSQGLGLADRKAVDSGAKVDKWGRIAARGRAKSARATVWLMPTELMQSSSANAEPTESASTDAFVERVGEQESPESVAATTENVPSPTAMYGAANEPTIGRVLVNNKAMVDELPEIHARDIVLEPFSLTQTLGEFNVFAIATQGGKTSRARAVAQAIARCLHKVQGPKAKELLENSGLLETDPRVRLRSLPNRIGHRRTRRAAGRPGKAKRAIKR